MSDNRHIDLDALLDETSLSFTLGGERFTVRDLPVSLGIKMQGAEALDNRTVVVEALGPSGLTDEKLTAFESEGKVGTRAIQALALAVMDFFVPSDLIEKMKIRPEIAKMALGGLAPSPTSLPSTPDTVE